MKKKDFYAIRDFSSEDRAYVRHALDYVNDDFYEFAVDFFYFYPCAGFWTVEYSAGAVMCRPWDVLKEYLDYRDRGFNNLGPDRGEFLEKYRPLLSKYSRLVYA